MNNLLNRSALFVRRNGSTILTCIGGVGVIATAVMAAKATPKALKHLEQVKEEKGEELTKFETLKTVGPAYIPTVVTGAATLVCIFGANVINKKQQASLTSAYALVSNSYKQYKDKVKDLYGEEVDAHIKKEIVKEKIEKEDVKLSEEGNTKLFYDNFSMRYFESTMEDVIRAEYEINRRIGTNGGAYLNEFYELLGIPKVDYADELGWSCGILSSMYWADWLDFDHSQLTMEDGLECTILEFRYEPVIDFDFY